MMSPLPNLAALAASNPLVANALLQGSSTANFTNSAGMAQTTVTPSPQTSTPLLTPTSLVNPLSTLGATATGAAGALNVFEGMPIYLVPGATGLPLVQQKNLEMKVNWATQPGTGPGAAPGGPVVAPEFDEPIGPKVDTSKHYHIFVGDLSPEVDNKSLHDAFQPFGEITEAKVIRDLSNNKSKGYGFVAYPNKEDAERAIEQMNGAWLGRRAIRTNWATRRGANAQQRTLNFDEVYNQTSPNNTSVYVGSIPSSTTEDDLRRLFAKFGNIVEIRLFKNQGYAFIRYDAKDAACHAICNNNNAEMDGQVIRCSWGRAADLQQQSQGGGGGGGNQYGYGYGYGGGYGAGGGPGGMAAAAQAQQAQQYWQQYYQYYNNPAVMQQWQSYWQQQQGGQ